MTRIVAALVSALLTPTFLSAQTPGEQEQCLHYLDFVVTKIREKHPNPLHRISERQFASGISAAKVEIRDAMSAMECYLVIKKVVACIQDGYIQLFDGHEHYPNSFGSMNVVGIVPNRGWGLGVSSRQNDNSWSPDRVFYAPELPAPFTSQDFFSGVDPALELIFSDID